eukprot:m.236470 g.236470  ORF g.236470 m.236470 type:complete len:348 (-) comp12976_c0_seq1:132-1175(-)
MALSGAALPWALCALMFLAGIVYVSSTWPASRTQVIQDEVNAPDSPIERAIQQPAHHVVAAPQEAPRVHAAAATHRLESHAVEHFQRLAVENAQRKNAERDAWLSAGHNEGVHFATLTPRETPMYYMFTPVYPCFGTFEKTPSCTVQHDGGKWLCGLQEMAAAFKSGERTTPCVVYSFGSNNDFAFENHVHSLVPECEIHTFDPTSRPPPASDPAAKFVKWHGDFGLGGRDEAKSAAGFPVKSLGTIMTDLQHTSVDIVKIDVEGFEWQLIRDTDWPRLRFGQFLMEFHPNIGGGPPNAGSYLDYFHKIESSGLLLASIEPVTYTNFGQVEVAFLHKDWHPTGFKAQ